MEPPMPGRELSIEASCIPCLPYCKRICVSFHFRAPISLASLVSVLPFVVAIAIAVVAVVAIAVAVVPAAVVVVLAGSGSSKIGCGGSRRVSVDRLHVPLFGTTVSTCESTTGTSAAAATVSRLGDSNKS